MVQLAGLPCTVFFYLSIWTMMVHTQWKEGFSCIPMLSVCKLVICVFEHESVGLWCVLWFYCHGQRELWNFVEDLPNHLAQLALGTPKRSVQWCILHFWTVLCAGVVISSRSSHCFYSDAVPKLYNGMKKPCPVAWFRFDIISLFKEKEVRKMTANIILAFLLVPVIS